MFTQRRHFQTHGFTSLGFPIREEIFDNDPRTAKCSLCGDFFDPEENGYAYHALYDICSACFEEQKTVDNAVAFAKDSEDTVSVNINAAIAEALSTDKINEILTEYVMSHKKDCEYDMGCYIDKCKDEFAGFLEENYS